MASYNNTLFICVLVVISALMAAAPSTAIDISLTPPISVTDIIVVRGILYCALNITLSTTGNVLANTPRFPNAALQLGCGNRILANTRTNILGGFSIPLVDVLNDVQGLLNFLVTPANNCTLVVTTPLASCNATLPGSGANLISTLLPGITDNSNGLFGIFSAVPAGFRLFG